MTFIKFLKKYYWNARSVVAMTIIILWVVGITCCVHISIQAKGNNMPQTPIHEIDFDAQEPVPGFNIMEPVAIKLPTSFVIDLAAILYNGPNPRFVDYTTKEGIRYVGRVDEECSAHDLTVRIIVDPEPWK